MADRNVGIALAARTPQAAVDQIVDYDVAGINAVWSTSIAGGGDALTLLTAAAAQTSRIMLETSIAQIWTRHPVTMAQQALIAEGLAPGRFRLGIGTGHKAGMVSSLGAPFESPLGHLKEYLRILRVLFKNGEIDFEGRHYTARTSIPAPVDLPVMASALRPRSFEVCGEMSDGAISWLCPAQYIEETALPALRSGAAKAGNDVPPLVMHVPVAVHGDRDEVYAAFAEQASFYLQAPFFAAMFERAGFSAVGQSGWTREMLDAVVVTGSEEEVAGKIEGFLDFGGVEVLGMVITGASRGGLSVPLPLEGAPAVRTAALRAELSAN